MQYAVGHGYTVNDANDFVELVAPDGLVVGKYTESATISEIETDRDIDRKLVDAFSTAVS